MAAFKVSNIQMAEFTRTIWDFTPPAGTTPEDVEKSENWLHIANAPRHKRIKPRDLVLVEPEDGAWFGMYRVLTTNAGGARLCKLMFDADVSDPREKPQQKILDLYEIRYIPAHRGFRIKRKSDGAVLQTGVEGRENAEQWVLKNHSRQPVAA